MKQTVKRIITAALAVSTVASSAVFFTGCGKSKEEKALDALKSLADSAQNDLDSKSEKETTTEAEKLPEFSAVLEYLDDNQLYTLKRPEYGDGFYLSFPQSFDVNDYHYVKQEGHSLGGETAEEYKVKLKNGNDLSLHLEAEISKPSQGENIVPIITRMFYDGFTSTDRTFNVALPEMTAKDCQDNAALLDEFGKKVVNHLTDVNELLNVKVDSIWFAAQDDSAEYGDIRQDYDSIVFVCTGNISGVDPWYHTFCLKYPSVINSVLSGYSSIDVQSNFSLNIEKKEDIKDRLGSGTDQWTKIK